MDEVVLQDETERASLFDEAIKYLHMILLRDLRPPWLSQNFPQALPGDGILSLFTRPSFLQWDVSKMKVLFGAHLMAILLEVAAAVSVEVAGALARPLYVCMDRRGHFDQRQTRQTLAMQHIGKRCDLARGGPVPSGIAIGVRRGEGPRVCGQALPATLHLSPNAKTFQQRGSATWWCVLDMANSFAGQAIEARPRHGL